MIFKNEAKWIAAPEEQIPAPLFRKEIHLREKPVSMKLTVTAVGAHVVYFDGARVDDAILNPCYSDNRKTVYVNTVELEKMPEAGRHALGVVLGRSRSAMKTPNTWGWHTPPLGQAEEIHIAAGGGLCGRFHGIFPFRPRMDMRLRPGEIRLPLHR